MLASPQNPFTRVEGESGLPPPKARPVLAGQVAGPVWTRGERAIQTRPASQSPQNTGPGTSLPIRQPGLLKAMLAVQSAPRKQAPDATIITDRGINLPRLAQVSSAVAAYMNIQTPLCESFVWRKANHACIAPPRILTHFIAAERMVVVTVDSMATESPAAEQLAAQFPLPVRVRAAVHSEEQLRAGREPLDRREGA